jgi:hypothetical protein
LERRSASGDRVVAMISACDLGAMSYNARNIYSIAIDASIL